MNSKVDMQDIETKQISVTINTWISVTSKGKEYIGEQDFENLKDDILTLITTLRRQDLEEVRKDFPIKGLGFVTFGELRAYLDSKIESLKK